MSFPLFSIILPTKNNSRTIKKCLESILNQSYENFEVIFVDNFSTDNTIEIAKSFEDKMNIKIFQVGPERNVQRKFGFEKSAGDFVYFIDSDMYLSPRLVEEAIKLFFENSILGGLIVPEDNTEGKKYWTKVKAFERGFYDGDDTIEAARIFPRKIYENAGGYDSELIAGEDWDLSERVKKAGNIITRTTSRVEHDEGEIEIFKLLKKKMYYGGEIGGYIKNNGSGSILSKIYIFRGVFYKKFYKFLQKPLLFPGFIILMTSELVAGGVGFIKSKIKK